MRTFSLLVLRKKRVIIPEPREVADTVAISVNHEGQEDSDSSTTIIAPEIEHAFKVSDDASIDVIRENLLAYLKTNPHKIPSAVSCDRSLFVVKNDDRYETEWLNDNIAGVNGVLIHFDTKNLSTNYNIPVIAVTVLFLLFEAGSAYFDTIITEVNLPDSTAQASQTLAWMQTTNDTLQDIIQYFAFQTPQYIDYFSKKVTSFFRKKEYDLSNDFESPSQCQKIKTMCSEHPKKAIALTLLSTSMVGFTVFGMIMRAMVGYNMCMMFITKAHDNNITSMDLNELKIFATVMFALDNTFNLIFQIEKFSMAINAAILIYNAIQSMANNYSQKKSCLNPFSFAFSSSASKAENEALLPEAPASAA